MTASLSPSLLSNCAMTAIGSFVPEQRLTNADLEKLVETTDEWIVQRTGIRERRIAGEHEYTSHLIIGAVDDMIRRYGTVLADVDYIIVATSTPDTIFPSLAAGVQEHYGIESCGAVDIQAACAGFAAGLQLANGLLLSGMYRKVLVIGADALSKITDYTDRTTCILFGDGAGAAILERTKDGIGHMLAAYSDTDGAGGRHVYAGHLSAAIGGHPIANNGKIVQNGREVYRWAVSRVSEGIRKLLAAGRFAVEDIDWFVPHSANMRIIEALCERTGFRTGQVLSCIAHYGNTSAATIPLAISEAAREGLIAPGQLLLLHGFGGGLTQAGVIMRWTAPGM